MSIEVMRQALEALEVATTPLAKDRQEVLRAITTIREVLAEQPAQQSSKPLTDEQIMEMYNEPRSDAEMIAFARAIEAAHGIGEQK